MELTPAEAQKAWQQAAEKVKDRVISPTLYRAVEAGVGITLDGDLFVLGFGGADLPLAGHLRSAQHNATILQALAEVLNKPVRLLTIDGTTIEDYENYKRLRAMGEAVSASMSERRAKERQVEQAWEEIAEKITRGYARLPLHSLAQNRGLFIRQAFKLIHEGAKSLGYTDDADEIHKRSLSRVFDKFSNVIEVPSAMLAYEYLKLRDEGKLD
jgi:hypothetical protein